MAKESKDYRAEDVTLRELLEEFKRDTLLSINCHALGEVQSFDKDKQTCTVKISYDKRYTETREDGTLYDIKRPYPLLVDIPVFFAGGSEKGFSSPVAKNDGCLVLFNDRDIDNWFEGATDGYVRTGRIHSLSDGIAIVGVRAKGQFLQSFDESRVSLFYGNTCVAASEEKILIKNQAENLNTILQDLVIAIKGITTTAPATVTPASQAVLDAIAVRIGGLLE